MALVAAIVVVLAVVGGLWWRFLGPGSAPPVKIPPVAAGSVPQGALPPSLQAGADAH